MRPLLLFAQLIFCFSATCTYGQMVKTEFGKNRVQFNDDFREWVQYESPNFRAYWYGPAKNVAQAAVQLAEYDHAEIQSLLEHKISSKIEIIVYTDLTDIKQANIGDEEVFPVTGSEHPLAAMEAAQGKRLQSNLEISQLLNGRVNGFRIFVYFDGNHQHLRRQIREGIATIYLNSMLFGSNIQEMVQNAVSYSLPAWFKQGIVAYAAEPWNPELDNVLKDCVLNPEFPGFKKFAKQNPQLAGHAFWYYISLHYGKQTLSNLLYLTRINRNIESGFQYILGGTVSKTFEAWENYFTERYENDQASKEPFAEAKNIKFRGNVPISAAKLSPDGKQFAYVCNEAGKCRVYVQEIEGSKRRKIKKTGFYNVLQSTDYDYPIIAWKPDGRALSVLYEQKDIRKIYIYDFELKKGNTELLSPDFQRVYAMEYLSNTELALSATTNGFSDIFIYKPVSRTYRRITNDFYDDLDIGVFRYKGQRGLLWASNRPDTALTIVRMDTILPTGNFDIFFLNMDKKENGAVQITATPLVQERHPTGINSEYLAYLSDANGIINRDVAYLDTVFDHTRTIIIYKDGAREQLDGIGKLSAQDTARIDTFWHIPVYRTAAKEHSQSNYGRNIISQHFAADSTAMDLYFEQGKFRISTSAIEAGQSASRLNTAFRQLQLLKLSRSQGGIKKEGKDNSDKKESTELRKDTTATKPDPFADYFQSEFPNPAPKTQAPVQTAAEKKSTTPEGELKYGLTEKEQFREVHKFRGTRVIPYRLKFRLDEFRFLNFDNSPILSMPDLFVGGYGINPLGIHPKITLKELFEDYQVEIGARYSLLLNGQFNTLGSFSPTNPTNSASNAGSDLSFNNKEYYLRISDKKRRFDRKYTYYHKATLFSETRPTSEIYKSRLLSDVGQVEWSFPFNTFHSLKMSAMLRLDKLIYLATDSTTLRAPSRNEQRIGLNVSYVYDNVLMLSNNSPVGTRLKVYTYGMQGIRIQLSGERAFDLTNGFMGVVGFDARHYLRLDRRSILAIRLTGASAFGSEKMLYVIGGVEGALRPPLGNNLAIPGGNYAYLTQAAQMRGFYSNIRNGNSFFLLNTEIRIPVMLYLFPNIRATWLKNLQATGFFDCGSAWQDGKLFSTDNPLNTVNLPENNPNSPVSIRVNYFRDPVVMGTGYGFRTTLFGYFVKFEYAWGIETRVFQKPVKHFSIGLDF